MSTPTEPDVRPRISATAAQLFVADVAASVAYFTKTLGFDLVFLYGAPPYYARVRRGAGHLNLKQTDAPVIDPGTRDRESLLSADFSLDDPESLTRLFREFQAADAPFHQSLRREPWGALTFIVKDPDGNLLLFAAPAPKAVVECVR